MRKVPLAATRSRVAPPHAGIAIPNSKAATIPLSLPLERFIISSSTSLQESPQRPRGALDSALSGPALSFMRLRHIEVFNAIMVTGTVSAAARLLNVSQPSVTRVLQHAELRLGFPLFRRAQGRLLATEEAIALHAEVEKLFVQLDAVRRLADNLRRGESGHLRVLAIPSLAQSVLADALAELRKQRPSMSFEVRTLHSREIIAALLLREADLGFVFEAPAHAAIHADEIGQCELVVAIPRGAVEQQGATIAIDALCALPQIRLPA